MATKLTVLLINTRGPFHYTCQHIAAIATDIKTGRTFEIDYSAGGQTSGFKVYSNLKDNPLSEHDVNFCCTGAATLFSPKDFDIFLLEMKNKFQNKSYNYCSNNCADIVNFAINQLCPDKVCTEVSCCLYQTLCCPLFFGTIGLSCFPSPPCACTTPQDIFDKARWLAKWTSYGNVIDQKNCETKTIHIESKNSTSKSLTNSLFTAPDRAVPVNTTKTPNPAPAMLRG